MISKEISDAAGCPLVPPNCPQFVAVKGAPIRDIEHLVFVSRADWVECLDWDPENDVSWNVEFCSDHQRPIIAAVAYCAWLSSVPTQETRDAYLPEQYRNMPGAWSDFRESMAREWEQWGRVQLEKVQA